MRIVNVMAVSLDGKIAAHPQESDQERSAYGFINSHDAKHLQQQLYQADAVIIGAETLRASGQALAVKNHRGIFPPWVIFTRRGLEAELGFWQQKQLPKLLISPKPLVPQAFWGENTYNHVYGERPAAAFTCEQLKRFGAKQVLLFGGGSVNSLFYQEGLVDELRLTLAPFLLATANACSLLAQPLVARLSLSLLSSQIGGDHVFLNYTVNK